MSKLAGGTIDDNKDNMQELQGLWGGDPVHLTPLGYMQQDSRKGDREDSQPAGRGRSWPQRSDTASQQEKRRDQSERLYTAIADKITWTEAGRRADAATTEEDGLAMAAAAAKVVTREDMAAAAAAWQQRGRSRWPTKKILTWDWNLV